MLISRDDAFYVAYHDDEWSRPVAEDRATRRARYASRGLEPGLSTRRSCASWPRFATSSHSVGPGSRRNLRRAGCRKAHDRHRDVATGQDQATIDIDGAQRGAGRGDARPAWSCRGATGHASGSACATRRRNAHVLRNVARINAPEQGPAPARMGLCWPDHCRMPRCRRWASSTTTSTAASSGRSSKANAPPSAARRR